MKKPHMTVGRELTKEEIEKCYELFNTHFSHSFHSNSLAIRKFNEVEGQYNIIAHIPLSGEGYQMNLEFE